MGYIGDNIAAILVATACGLGLGILFHLAGRRVAGTVRAPSPGFVLVAALAEAWLAAILAGALILAPAAGPGPWTMALASAVVIWIGFVLPTTLVSFLHAGRSAPAALAYAAQWLAVMVAQAAALQTVGLVRPT